MLPTLPGQEWACIHISSMTFKSPKHLLKIKLFNPLQLPVIQEDADCCTGKSAGFGVNLRLLTLSLTSSVALSKLVRPFSLLLLN